MRKTNPSQRFSATFLGVVILLVVVILAVPMVSAVWWNPFTWFGNDDATITKDGGWYLSHLDGIQLENFNTEIQNLANGKAKICLLPKTNMKITNQIIKDSKATLKQNNIQTRLVQPSDMELETEAGNVKKMCIDVDMINENEARFGENSALFVYTSESITATEDGIEIGKLSLSTEGFDYKLGKPNIQTSRGTNKLTHTFYIENYTSDAITNLRTIDMNNDLEVERNANLKYLTYVESQEDTYGYSCSNVTNGTNTTEVCTPYVNGSIFVLKEQWNNMSLAVTGQNYLVGVFADVLKNDYVDIDFDYYGTSIMASPINWATFSESLRVGIISHYTLNETSGTTAYDFIGSNDLANAGATINQVGKIDKAYLTGANPSQSSGTFAGLPTGAASRTACSWAYPTSAASKYIFAWGAGGTRTAYQIAYLAAGQFNLITSGSDIVGANTYSLDNWYYVCSTYDGTTSRLYVNGNNEGNFTHTLATTSSNFYIGSYYAGTEWFVGRIDEVTIWNRTLSQAEIVELSAGLNIAESLGTAPSVTLTSPANGTNTTSSSQEFSFTATDDLDLDNVTIVLDGVSNLTITTGFNGSYTETITGLAEGVHTWSVIAVDNQSLSNQTANWTFNYTQPPIYIDLLSPADASTKEVPAINISCRAYETTGVLQLNLTIDGVVNTTVTNSTPAENLTIQGFQNFAEGNYTWGCSAYNDVASAVSANRTFEVLYSSPVVSLTSPANATSSTNPNITFVASVTDLNGISNVSLYIDGIVNQTNTSGVNGSYSFDINGFPDAVYDWKIGGISIYGKETNSTSRQLTVHTVEPEVAVTAPSGRLGYFIIGNNETLTYSITETGENLTEHIDSCWYEYNNTQGLTNITYDGSSNKVWSFNSGYANVTSVTIKQGALTSILTDIPIECSHKGNFTLKTVGFTVPYQTVVSCFTDATTITTIDTISSGAEVQTANITAMEKRDLNCTGSSASFEYVYGYNNITVYALDTFGLLSSDTTSWTYDVAESSIDYEPVVLELSSVDFEYVFSYDPTRWSSTTVYLNYDGVNYTAGTYTGTTTRNYTRTVNAPIVTSLEEVPFYWLVRLTNATGIYIYNTSTYTQNVTDIQLFNCSVANYTLFNMFLFDEETGDELTGTIETYLQLYIESDPTEFITFSYNATNASNFSICWNNSLEDESLLLNTKWKYYAPGHNIEYYNIRNYVANETSLNQTINLYSLNTTVAEIFQISYKGSSFLPVSEALIVVSREFVFEGGFKTVEIPITDTDGKTTASLVKDTAVYNFYIYKDGVLLATFQNVIPVCVNELTGECNINLNAASSTISIDDFSETDDMNHLVTFDKTTREIVLTYATISGSSADIQMTAVLFDGYENDTICDESVVSSSGTLSCTVPESYMNKTVTLRVYKDDASVSSYSLSLKPDASDFFGYTGYFLAFIMIIMIPFMFITSVIGIIVGLMIGVLLTGLLLLSSGANVGTLGGAVAWFMVAAAALIYKLNTMGSR